MKWQGPLLLSFVLGLVGCKSAAAPGSASSNAGSAGPAHVAETPAQAITPADFSTATFDVNVTLTPAAVAELKNIHEMVSVLATFTGKAKADAPKGVGDEHGEVFLGNDLEQEPAGKTVRFKAVKLDKTALAATDGNSPKLEVTVNSSILHSGSTWLNCTTYDAPLATVQGKSIAISCKDLSE